MMTDRLSAHIGFMAIVTSRHSVAWVFGGMSRAGLKLNTASAEVGGQIDTECGEPAIVTVSWTHENSSGSPMPMVTELSISSTESWLAPVAQPRVSVSPGVASGMPLRVIVTSLTGSGVDVGVGVASGTGVTVAGVAAALGVSVGVGTGVGVGVSVGVGVELGVGVTEAVGVGVDVGVMLSGGNVDLDHLPW